jgi:hypothetical protein
VYRLSAYQEIMQLARQSFPEWPRRDILENDLSRNVEAGQSPDKIALLLKWNTVKYIEAD